MLLDDESIAVELARTGVAVREQFLPPDVIAALLEQARTAHARGEFRRAAVGPAAGRVLDRRVRGDETLWLDPAAAGDAENAYLAAMEALRVSINRCMQLGAFDLEAHYAFYEVGAAYARHGDRPRGSSTRVVSTVLYLNEDWDERDGGALRLYLDTLAPALLPADTPVRDVLPRAGVFVAFLSEGLEHEVLPATRERWSITAWLRRRPTVP